MNDPIGLDSIRTTTLVKNQSLLSANDIVGASDLTVFTSWLPEPSFGFLSLLHLFLLSFVNFKPTGLKKNHSGSFDFTLENAMTAQFIVE